MICPEFADHLVFRVTELDRTERFYTALLGQPAQRIEASVMYKAGDTRLFFTRADEQQERPYEKEKVGLNHIAFGVRTIADLQAIEEQLSIAGIPHSVIMQDKYGMKEFVWLDDPDGLRIEFYMRPL